MPESSWVTQTGLDRRKGGDAQSWVRREVRVERVNVGGTRRGGEYDQNALHKNILKRTIRTANRDKSSPLKILPRKNKPQGLQATPKQHKNQSWGSIRLLLSLYR